ncbi:MAG TPA: ABC transporter ATP-binding protein, partial [Xanthobacteraceae bacterium]|nr:ABC transporter ATP-binding protein [Xanthobacteraceae bacterium]
RWVEYAGGYSDMLAQRKNGDIKRNAGSDQNAKGDRRESKAASAPREKAPGKRRLSFHEQHALKTLPDRIATLENEVRKSQQQVEDPTLYARDRKAFEAASSALGKAQSELAEAEEKWLELEMLRAEIEGG